VQDVESLVDIVSGEAQDFVLVQVQGREGEARLLEPVLRREKSGQLIVFIHRPEELILRLAEERGLTYADARSALARMMEKVDAVVLPGPCMLAEYREMLPLAAVEAIPLGFDPPTVSDVPPSRISADSIVAIGSSTTWGEMRDIDDLLNLFQATRTVDTQARVLGYALGKCDSRVDLKQYLDNEGVHFVCNDHLYSALRRGDFQDEEGFRTWLFEEAAGRLIIRARIESGTPVMESIPPAEEQLHAWEARLLDFNVQMYREILDERREPNRRGGAKVEYSGTLHKGMRHVIFVAFQSPAMDDVRDFEGLSMVEVPIVSGTPDYVAGAKSLVDLVRHPDGRRQVIDGNRAAMACLGMDEVAFAYCLLFRSLQE